MKQKEIKFEELYLECSMDHSHVIQRYEVPGGWIYETRRVVGEALSIATAFVPELRP